MKRRRTHRKKHNIKAFVFIIAIFLILIYGFLWVDQKIKPAFLTIAEVKARDIATKAINKSVEEVSQKVKYQDLILIRTDQEGNITMMQANTCMTKMLNRVIKKI